MLMRELFMAALGLLICAAPVLMVIRPSFRILMAVTIILSIIAGAFVCLGSIEMARAASSLDGGVAGLARSQFYFAMTAVLWFGALLLAVIGFAATQFRKACRAEIDRLLASE